MFLNFRMTACAALLCAATMGSGGLVDAPGLPAASLAQEPTAAEVPAEGAAEGAPDEASGQAVPTDGEDRDGDDRTDADNNTDTDGDTVPGNGDFDAAEDASTDAGTDPETAGTERDWGRFQPVADLVEAGGPIIIMLGILSVLSLAIILVKVLQFAVLRAGDHRFVDKVAQMLADGNVHGALDFVSRRRGVVARVMETALRGRQLGARDEQVREEVERVARMKLDGLESGLPFLSLIATISPLLGLLGTVLGMIEAFQQLETAGDRVDPAILSGGIWEALLTTAAGLSVAIPAAAFFTWLQRTVDVAGQHMEDAATRVFTSDIYATRSRNADNDPDEEDEA